MTIDEKILAALATASQRRMPGDALACAIDVDPADLAEAVQRMITAGRLSQFEVLGTTYVVAPGSTRTKTIPATTAHRNV
jgi:hypothetical protein